MSVTVPGSGPFGYHPTPTGGLFTSSFSTFDVGGTLGGGDTLGSGLQSQDLTGGTLGGGAGGGGGFSGSGGTLSEHIDIFFGGFNHGSFH